MKIKELGNRKDNQKGKEPNQPCKFKVIQIRGEISWAKNIFVINQGKAWCHCIAIKFPKAYNKNCNNWQYQKQQ